MATHDDSRSSCADRLRLSRFCRSIRASGTTLEHAGTLLHERYGVKDYFPSTLVAGIQIEQTNVQSNCGVQNERPGLRHPAPSRESRNVIEIAQCQLRREFVAKKSVPEPASIQSPRSASGMTERGAKRVVLQEHDA